MDTFNLDWQTNRIWTSLPPLSDSPTLATYTGNSSPNSLNGGATDDELYGLGGNDTLRGNGGNDSLFGGDGADFMYGGTGDDTYVISIGEGAGANQNEFVWENAGEGTDTVLLSGITASQVTFSSFGSNFLVLQIDDGLGGYTSTSIVGYEDLWAYIERIEFGDGTYLDATTGFNHVGTAGDDSYLGASSDDTLTGGAGADTLYGMGGNDTLHGGSGIDLMSGGLGDDLYYLDAGDGALFESTTYDVLNEYTGQGTDTLRIRGVGPSEIQFMVQKFGAGAVYAIGIEDAAGDFRYTILAGAPYVGSGFWDAWERIEFDNGTVWTELTGAVFRGGATDDALYATEVGDRLYGRQGNDDLSGYAGDDTLFGGSGDDDLNGGAGNDTLRGGSGEDAVFGGQGDDTYQILMTDGAGQGDDTLAEYVGQGNDTIHFVGIDPTELQIVFDIPGITGGPSYYYFGMTDATGTTRWTTIDAIYGNPWQIFENITFDDGTTYTAATGLTQYGADADDTLWATISGDDLYGGAGNDTLQGREGDDVFYGGTGADYLWGRGGDDTYHVTAGEGGAQPLDETLREGWNNGSDTIRLHGVLPSEVLITYSNSHFHFGLAADGVDLTWFNIGVGLDAGWADFWSRFEQIEFDDGTIWTQATGIQVTGSDQDDTMDAFVTGGSLTGLGGDDILNGNDGVDHLFGGAGNDTLWGGLSADTLSGGTGVDVMLGEGGSDTYLIDYGDGDLNVIGTDRIVESGGSVDTDIIQFGAGITLYDIFVNVTSNSISFGLQDGADIRWTTVSNVNVFTNGFGAVFDYIEEIHFEDGLILTENTVAVTTGTAADEILQGSFLDDDLLGEGGNDQLFGSGGTDFLFGGAGDDTLAGGDGNDDLFGGAGADVFQFNGENGVDTVRDFEDGVDKLDFSAFLDLATSVEIDVGGVTFRRSWDGEDRDFGALDLYAVQNYEDAIIYGVFYNGSGGLLPQVFQITILDTNLADLSYDDMLF